MALNLYDALRERCSADAHDCRINLATVTDFQWDRVVFVKMTASTKAVAAATGVDIPARQEFEDLVLFVEKDVIVASVARQYSPEEPFRDTVFLDFSNTSEKFLVFPRAEATFIARRVGPNSDNILLSAR